VKLVDDFSLSSPAYVAATSESTMDSNLNEMQLATAELAIAPNEVSETVVLVPACCYSLGESTARDRDLVSIRITL